MKASDSDGWALEIRLAVIGAFLGPVLLYFAGYFIRNADDAFGLIDYFWSMPAGAVTGYLMPSAWPAKQD
jgi:uncharacterized membrane protein YeaQ/YmgE (transglycosylase-associated protein family)